MMVSRGRTRLTTRDERRLADERVADHDLRLRGDEGTALVELSLLLPFLAMMVFGTMDLGRAFALRNRLTNIAREGAFYAQYHPTDVSGCSPSSITQAALGEDLALNNVTITVTNATTGAAVTNLCGGVVASGTRITVQASSPMTILTPLVGQVVGNPVTVASSSEVVVQG
jgi:Flp pilus assembly protein TadG